MSILRDPYLSSRLLVVVVGFALIILDGFILSPFLRYTGGFVAIYAFVPLKVNPLLQYLGRKMNRTC